MERPRTLQFGETIEFEKVKEFLNSMAINSQQTKNVYHVALAHFQTFLFQSEYKDYNIESILVPISDNSVDVYKLLNKFVMYLTTRQNPKKGKLSPASFSLYVTAVRSYLEHHDIEISIKKFKRRVILPKKTYGITDGIDAEDIRKLLLACTNTRLKAFMLVVASSGMRANEALSLRNRDLDYSLMPCKVHLRAEITKTKQANDIYISDEAFQELKTFAESKYKDKLENIKSNHPNELIFSIEKETEPISMYKTLRSHFIRLLEKVGMDKRRDGDQRWEISFHSFRAFVKTTISNQGYGDFSEWILGHRSSMAARYYKDKEQKRREIYKKCMKYLTFLDYTTVVTVGKDFESKLQERDKEIDQLKNGMEELKRMYMKSMAGHVVMESDLDSKGRIKRKIIK